MSVEQRLRHLETVAQERARPDASGLDPAIFTTAKLIDLAQAMMESGVKPPDQFPQRLAGWLLSRPDTDDRAREAAQALATFFGFELQG